MKKSNLKPAISALLLGSLLITGCKAGITGEGIAYAEPMRTDEELTVFVTSDIHYLAPSLIDGGPAFRRYTSGGDGKNLVHIDRITEAFKDEVLENAPDVLIVSGDLTNNGEKESHLALAQIFREMEAGGTSVYVTPGNHDVNNPHARGFSGDRQFVAETVTPEEFSQIYSEFGFQEAELLDESSLSYLAKPSEDTWILMVDTNKYMRNKELGYPEAGGILSLKTHQFIRAALAEAEEAGAEVITVSHHNALIHSEIAVEDYVLDNHEEYLNNIRRSGVRLNLTGHIHIQDIQVNRDKEPFYEIASNALSVYPHKYGVIQVYAEDELEYMSSKVDLTQIMAGSSTRDFVSLDAWSRSYFMRNSTSRIRTRLLEESSAEPADIDIMAEAIGELNVLYFGGDESLMNEEMLAHEGFRLMKESGDERTRYYLERIFQEKGPDDNYLHLP